MMKRFTIPIIIVIITLGAVFFFINSSGEDAFDEQSKERSQGDENQDDSETEDSLTPIFDLAKQGKIPEHPILVGETTAKEVQENLGEPDGTTDTNAGLFLHYSSQEIDLGITDDIVSDLRSSEDSFTSFDLDTIESYKEPDDIRYNEGENKDQMILVYERSDDYVLKWVLPNPDDDSKNPHVDYISLSKKIDDGGVNEVSSNPSSEKGIRNMSLDEKIGQMIFSGVDGTEMTAETKNTIENYHVGGIILFGDNIESGTQTVTFLNEIKTANEANPYPLLLGVDEEGGSVTRMPDGIKSLPTSQSIGEINDPELSFRVGAILGEQMNALGFNLDFAPVLDVNSNPNNPVIGDRSFSEDPAIVTELGMETMKGIQSENIISVIKHFPGHGDTSVDSHLELPKVNKSAEELTELELAPFKQAISEGADVTMVAHILLPKVDEDYPASMSKKVNTDMLRGDYDFDGVIITDDLTMEAITDHYHVADAAVQSVKAGADLLLVAHDPNLIADVFDQLKAAVRDGEISEDRIDESVKRIIHLKEKYHLSDEATPQPDLQPINEEVEAIFEELS